MKQNYLFALGILFLSSWISAQIPSGYYNSANGLTGSSLKTVLNQIIDGHTTYSYTSSGTDVWDILKQTDKDPNNSNNVILFYTGWSVNAAQEYNSGSGWTREHVWAKSRGNFGTSQGAGTDAHHLRPADVSVNSARNNRWFEEAPNQYFDGGIATGCYTSSSDWIWEPREAVKGDVARMLFYMVVRYEGANGEPDLELVDYIPTNNSTQDPIHAVLSTLIQWHLNDPVDAFEINRNNVVYSYQGNRNPFIDHPEYVCEIWGGTCTPSGGGGGQATAHVETFDNFTETTSYQTGSFTGTDGINWTYKSAKGNVAVDGKAACLGKGKSPAAELQSGIIGNGCATLTIEYQQAYSTMVNFDLYVNNTLIDNINTSVQGVNTTSATYNVNVSGDFDIRIVQKTSSSGQVAIDNISWTNTAAGSTAYLETFDNHNAPSTTYSNGNFTGDNGNSWAYVNARDDYNYTIDGQGLMLRGSSYGSEVSTSISGGVASVEFDLKKAFSGSGNRSVGLYINNALIGTTTGFDDANVHHYTFDNIDVSGAVDMEFRAATNKQVVIDNIEWTGYGSSKAISLLTDKSSEVYLYPNPTTGALFIEGGMEGEELTVEIYNVNGRKFMHKEMTLNGKSTLEISELPKGFYLIRISGTSTNIVKRISKI